MVSVIAISPAVYGTAKHAAIKRNTGAATIFRPLLARLWFKLKPAACWNHDKGSSSVEGQARYRNWIGASSIRWQIVPVQGPAEAPVLESRTVSSSAFRSARFLMRVSISASLDSISDAT